MAKYGAQDRRDLAKKGHALSDGSFPIADVEDLKSAIRNWALGKQPDVAKQFIIKRAKALNAMDVLPDNWNTTVAHEDFVDQFIAHFGVKGMRWGKTSAANDTSSARPRSTKIVPISPKINGKQFAVKATKFTVGEKVQLAAAVAPVAAYGGYKAFKKIDQSILLKNTINLQNAKRAASVASKMINGPAKDLPYAKIAKGVYRVTNVR